MFYAKIRFLKDFWEKIVKSGDAQGGIARELKQTVKHEGDSDTNCNRYSQNNPLNLGQRTGKLSN